MAQLVKGGGSLDCPRSRAADGAERGAAARCSGVLRPCPLTGVSAVALNAGEVDSSRPAIDLRPPQNSATPGYVFCHPASTARQLLRAEDLSPPGAHKKATDGLRGEGSL